MDGIVQCPSHPGAFAPANLWRRLSVVVVALSLGCAGNGPRGTAAATATPSPSATVTVTPSLTPTVPPTLTATVPPTDTPTTAPTPTVPPSPMPTDPCAVAGVICTTAGTGISAFDGDGKPALRTSFYLPIQVTFDRAGRPLILDWNNLRLRRLDADGTIETIMGMDFEGFPENGALAKDTSLHHASDVELDAVGQIYVAGNHVPVVFRVGTDDRVLVVAGTEDVGNDGDGGPALQATLDTPFGVLPAQDGAFYVSDAGAHVIRFVDAAGIIHTVAGSGTAGYSGDGGPGVAAQLNGPTRMRLDGAGNLYICDTDNHVIRRLDTGGVISTFAGTGTAGYSGDGGPAALAQLNLPYDMVFAPGGDIYVADSGNNVIRRIDRQGVVTTVVGDGTAGFAGDRGEAASCALKFPMSLAFAADGSMWIPDTFNQRVRRVALFLSNPSGTSRP